MPPRKSNVSVATNGDGGPAPGAGGSRGGRESSGLGVEDLNMPRTMVGRLAKGVLPPNTQIQKDALLAMSKSVTVFVNFLAANAGENAQAAGKKTIMPHDVFAALKDQEFEQFIPRVQAEMTKYNEIQCDKRNTYRRTKRAEQLAGTGEDGTDMATDQSTVNGASTDDGDAPPSKKVRREPGDVDGVAEGEAEDEAEEADEDEEDVPDEEEDSADEDGDDDEAEDDGVEADAEDEMLDNGDSEGVRLAGMRDEALDEPDSD